MLARRCVEPVWSRRFWRGWTTASGDAGWTDRIREREEGKSTDARYHASEKGEGHLPLSQIFLVSLAVVRPPAQTPLSTPVHGTAPSFAPRAIRFSREEGETTTRFHEAFLVERFRRPPSAAWIPPRRSTVDVPTTVGSKGNARHPRCPWGRKGSVASPHTLSMYFSSAGMCGTERVHTSSSSFFHPITAASRFRFFSSTRRRRETDVAVRFFIGAEERDSRTS